MGLAFDSVWASFQSVLNTALNTSFDVPTLFCVIILGILAVYDWRERRIRNSIITVTFIIMVLYGLDSGTWYTMLRSGVVSFAFYMIFWMLGVLYEGDVKVLTLLGAWFGFWVAAEYMIIACLLACIWIVYRKLRRKRIDGVPLISFLFLAFVLVIIFQIPV